jgi:hypothetical protein
LAVVSLAGVVLLAAERYPLRCGAMSVQTLGKT